MLIFVFSVVAPRPNVILNLKSGSELPCLLVIGFKDSQLGKSAQEVSGAKDNLEMKRGGLNEKYTVFKLRCS